MAVLGVAAICHLALPELRLEVLQHPVKVMLVARQFQVVTPDGLVEVEVEQVAQALMRLTGTQVMNFHLAHLEAPVYHQQLLDNLWCMPLAVKHTIQIR
jgi:hypothetical protein